VHGPDQARDGPFGSGQDLSQACNQGFAGCGETYEDERQVSQQLEQTHNFIADKPGALEGVRNDSGIVLVEARYCPSRRAGKILSIDVRRVGV